MSSSTIPLGEGSLVSLYFSYKRSTKKALDWLLSKADDGRRNGAFRNTAGIVEAAYRVKEQKLMVPEDVISNFRNAIKDRRAACELYSASCGPDSEMYSKHEAFIDRLEEAFQILSSLSDRSRQKKSILTSHLKSPPPSPEKNGYTCLEDEHTGSDTEDVVLESLNEPIQPSTPVDSASDEEDSDLEDDHLGENIKLTIFVYTLDAIFAQLKDYWTQAADGKISIILAAFLTTTAIAGIQRTVQGMYRIIPDHETFLKKWFYFRVLKKTKLRFPDMAPCFDSECDLFAEKDGVYNYWYTLRDLRESFNSRTAPSDAGKPRSPVGANAMEKIQDDMLHLLDEFCMIHTIEGNRTAEKIQDDMLHLLDEFCMIHTIEGNRTADYLLPLLKWVVQDKESPIPTDLVVGMTLLVATYKVFMWPHGNLNKTNCRIAALQFANKIRESLHRCYPVMKGFTEKSNYMDYQIDGLAFYDFRLLNYVKKRKFDLYYQAPWVAGSHMAEILYSASMEGISLCLRSGYLTAVLHVYNALRRVHPEMPKLLWLDQLCEIFAKLLFRGSLPRENFQTAFRLVLGARPVKVTNADNQTTFELGKVKPWDERPAIDLNHLSSFHGLHIHQYGTTKEFWESVYGIKNPENTPQDSKRLRKQMITELNTYPFSIPLGRIKETVFPEFHGELPTAMLDYCAIFRLSTGIMERIGLLSETDGLGTIDKANLGFETADYNAQSIYHVSKGRELGWSPFLSYSNNENCRGFLGAGSDKINSGFKMGCAKTLPSDV